MKKIGLLVCVIISLVLCACGKEETTNAVTNSPLPTATKESNNDSAVEATKVPEPTMEPVVESEENTSDVWVMKEAPIIRNSISEEEKISRQTAVLEKGTMLYSGKTNEGYYPNDISWLNEAGEQDALALIFACDDVTHGGWGVLGMVVGAKDSVSNQKDIAAYADRPQKERLMVYSMEELLQMANADKVNYVNAGLSGTPSLLGLIRSERDIFEAKPDVIFVEFAVNDGQDNMNKSAFESLVRKALEQEQEPAVVLLFSMTEDGYTC